LSCFRPKGLVGRRQKDFHKPKHAIDASAHQILQKRGWFQRHHGIYWGTDRRRRSVQLGCHSHPPHDGGLAISRPGALARLVAPPCAPSHRSIRNELHTQSRTQCLRGLWFAPQVKAAIYSRGRQSDPESRVGLSCCRASRFACHGNPWHVSTFDGRQLQRSDHLAVVH
jgi:hypothetical protein